VEKIVSRWMQAAKCLEDKIWIVNRDVNLKA
jgi:hypothetical protein